MFGHLGAFPHWPCTRMPPTDLASEVVDLASDDTPGMRPAKRLRAAHGALRVGVDTAARPQAIPGGGDQEKNPAEHTPAEWIDCQRLPP